MPANRKPQASSANTKTTWLAVAMALASAVTGAVNSMNDDASKVRAETMETIKTLVSTQAENRVSWEVHKVEFRHLRHECTSKDSVLTWALGEKNADTVRSAITAPPARIRTRGEIKQELLKELSRTMPDISN